MQAATTTDTAPRQVQQPQDVQQAKAEPGTSAPSAGDTTPATTQLQMGPDAVTFQPCAPQVGMSITYSMSC